MANLKRWEEGSRTAIRTPMNEWMNNKNKKIVRQIMLMLINMLNAVLTHPPSILQWTIPLSPCNHHVPIILIMSENTDWVPMLWKKNRFNYYISMIWCKIKMRTCWMRTKRTLTRPTHTHTVCFDAFNVSHTDQYIVNKSLYIDTTVTAPMHRNNNMRGIINNFNAVILSLSLFYSLSVSSTFLSSAAHCYLLLAH